MLATSGLACARSVSSFRKLAGQHDLPDGACDRVADAGIPRQIGVVLDEFVETFRQGADLRRRALIGLDLVGIFFLGRKQLRKARQPVRNLGIAEKRRSFRIPAIGICDDAAGRPAPPSCVVDFSAMGLLKTEGR